jgi:exosortase
MARPDGERAPLPRPGAVTREARLDLRWAAILGAVFAASPLSGAARLGVSAAAGVLVAAGVLGFRRWRRRRRPEPAPPPLLGLAGPAPLVFWLLLGCLAVFLPTLVWLFGQYTEAIWRNGHGLFVPVAMALLAASRLRRDGGRAEESSAAGAPLVVAGALLAALDAGVRSGFLGTVGLIVALPGLSLLLIGARRTRVIAFPLALAVFLIPLPEKVPEPLGLPTATAALAEVVLDQLGFAAVRRMTIFVMPAGLFNVSTNCSGVATLYAAIFFATLLAAVERTWWRALLVFASAWPITVGVNALRAAFLFAVCDRFGLATLHTPIHGLSGIATFWLVMASLYLIAGRPELWKVRP